ncbi:hypothetical protein RHSIM_Rhsim05G0189700 [Rhododendron simsii]|uniref:SANTA domain-containing protein n=1 Tax=Rhododendron simsii TaxID=118357 RepID=A0A834GVT6_RHOSS|nr:hypothetical protein RHSIM_Rhsim05G0189700 [Rhododendron simsii]
MATASASNADDSAANNAPPSSSSSSYFRKTVCLRDWWLIKSEQDFQGKRLAVSGLTSQEKQAVRAFTSAPILSRSDPLTLETVDGIYVLIDSCLNKVRTEENGFPYEVFSHFVFGFPTNWEEYAENCLEKECSNKDVSTTLGRDKLSTDSGTADDNSDGTPNRNTAAVSEERHSTSDNTDVNSEEKGHHKPQDDISYGTPNTNKSAFCEERHGTSDKMDVSSAEKGHYISQDGACNDSSLEGLSLSAGRTRDRSSSKMKSKLKGAPKSVKPVEYEENRLACSSLGENNMRNAAISGKRPSGRRSTSISSAVGLQPTDCETVDGNIARQAGKQGKNTSKTVRSCVGLSDVNQEAVVSEEKHGTRDNMDVNSEEKGHHKPQDDISDGTPNTNKSAFSEERHSTSDKMDVSSEEKGHYIPQDSACNDSSLEGLSLSAGRTRDRSSSKMKSKMKGDPKSVKSVEYEENRLACGSSGKNNMRNAAISGKRTSGRRSTSIPSAVGLQPTDCETVDGNIARQAGKQSKNTSKTLRSCVGLSDANQIDDLKIAGSKKETNIKDASKSREKTKRKLTYVRRLLLPTLEFWRNQLVIYDGVCDTFSFALLHWIIKLLEFKKALVT